MTVGIRPHNARSRPALRADFIGFHDGFAAPLGISMPREYLLIHGRR